MPGSGVVHPLTQPGAGSPSRRRGVVVTGAVEVAVGTAIEVVELFVVGLSAVAEVVGAAPSSRSEPLLLHPIPTRAPAATTAVTTRPSCRPAVTVMHRETPNHGVWLTPPTDRRRPTRPTVRPSPTPAEHRTPHRTASICAHAIGCLQRGDGPHDAPPPDVPDEGFRNAQRLPRASTRSGNRARLGEAARELSNTTGCPQSRR